MSGVVKGRQLPTSCHSIWSELCSARAPASHPLRSPCHQTGFQVLAVSLSAPLVFALLTCPSVTPNPCWSTSRPVLTWSVIAPRPAP